MSLLKRKIENKNLVGKEKQQVRKSLGRSIEISSSAKNAYRTLSEQDKNEYSRMLLNLKKKNVIKTFNLTLINQVGNSENYSYRLSNSIQVLFKNEAKGIKIVDIISSDVLRYIK